MLRRWSSRSCSAWRRACCGCAVIAGSIASRGCGSTRRRGGPLVLRSGSGGQRSPATRAASGVGVGDSAQVPFRLSGAPPRAVPRWSVVSFAREPSMKGWTWTWVWMPRRDDSRGVTGLGSRRWCWLGFGLERTDIERTVSPSPPVLHAMDIVFHHGSWWPSSCAGR